MTAPRVRIGVVEAEPFEGRWRVSWDVSNEGDAAFELQSAWLPHGRFRGDGRMLLDTVVADPGQSARLTLAVTAVEAPGTVVENAFLILRARSEGKEWQIFARMRVEFDAEARPQPVVELITTQSLE